MAMNIIWSKKATYSFYNIQNYLEQFWNPIVAEKFIKDVIHIVFLLEKNPMIGKYNPNLDCREILISKHVHLYYEIDENVIELIAFYNSNQKPPTINNL